MTQKQENIITMWDATDAVLKTFNAIWAPNAPFSAKVQAFRQVRKDMSRYLKTQNSDLSGIREDKDQARTDMTDMALTIAGNIRVFALDNGNHELAAEMDTTKSKLSRLGHTAFREKMAALIESADAWSGKIADYGTSADHIAEMKAAFVLFSDLAPAPRQAKTRRSVATDRIADLIRIGQDRLGMLDALINNFRKDYPDFVNQYDKARLIINTGTRRDDPKVPPSA